MTTPQQPAPTNKYTCNEYREEMILVALQKRLTSPDLSPEDRVQLIKDIDKLEADMGLS